jgi:hypothetical protein
MNEHARTGSTTQPAQPKMEKGAVMASLLSLTRSRLLRGFDLTPGRRSLPTVVEAPPGARARAAAADRIDTVGTNVLEA